MTSTAVRSTPNLTVPSSQNTAPVLEFRCLYTHDVRRKSKRWQDGFLRFHTFNKRVMVYDVPRNFIGDMHWRNDEPVEDGDELDLEKGVMVQVGEAIGSMEQDLTELLEKRRVAKVSPLAKKTTGLPSPCPSSGNTTTAPSTQLRPKSLNALLGTPRGRYGRAMLPTVSPFEERRQTNKPSFPEEGRCVKRQKLNQPPLNKIPQQSPSFPRARPSLPDRRPIPASTPKLAKPAVRRQKHQQHEVIEIDSADERTSEPRNNSIQLSLIPRSKRATPKQTRPTSPLFCSSSPPVSTTNHLPPANPVLNEPFLPKEPSASDDSVPVNPLRPAGRRPRKKLMYKDLLPPKQSPSRNDPSDAVPTAPQKIPKDTPAPAAAPDELSTFHQAQRRRLDARMRRQRLPLDSNPSMTSDSDEMVRFPDEADNKLDTIALPPRPRPRPRLAGPIAPTADDNSEHRTTPLPCNAVTRPPHPVAPLTSHLTAPLRRSDSAPNTSTLSRPAAHHESPVPVDHTPVIPSSKAKVPLRKCASLPIPLPAQPTGLVKAKGTEKETVTAKEVMGYGGGGGGANGKRGADEDQDTGPWSREAADLFAWRPPAVASASASASALTG